MICSDSNKSVAKTSVHGLVFNDRVGMYEFLFVQVPPPIKHC